MNSVAKLVTVALLAMVPSAFGAVTIDMTDGDGDNVWDLTANPIAAGTVLTLNLNIGITEDSEVAGYTVFLESSLPGAFRITGRTNNSAVIADATTLNAVLTHANFNLLNPVNGADIGATAPTTGIPELDAIYAPGDDAIQTLQLTAQVDITEPVLISFANTSYSDTSGRRQIAFDAVADYNIVPEPVSALLLVLGGLFVTRRRVA